MRLPLENAEVRLGYFPAGAVFANTNKEAALTQAAPSAAHWLGTDDIGRDVLSGIIHGSRYALAIGVVAMGIALLIGLALGSAAGFFGGAVDVIISRLIELVITFPTFFLIITIVAMFRAGKYLAHHGAHRLYELDECGAADSRVCGCGIWTSSARRLRWDIHGGG